MRWLFFRRPTPPWCKVDMTGGRPAARILELVYLLRIPQAANVKVFGLVHQTAFNFRGAGTARAGAKMMRTASRHSFLALVSRLQVAWLPNDNEQPRADWVHVVHQLGPPLGTIWR